MEPPVQAQPDHALQPVPVALDEGALVAVTGGVQKLLVGAVSALMVESLFPYPRTQAEPSPP